MVAARPRTDEIAVAEQRRNAHLRVQLGNAIQRVRGLQTIDGIQRRHAHDVRTIIQSRNARVRGGLPADKPHTVDGHCPHARIASQGVWHQERDARRLLGPPDRQSRSDSKQAVGRPQKLR